MDRQFIKEIMLKFFRINGINKLRYNLDDNILLIRITDIERWFPSIESLCGSYLHGGYNNYYSYIKYEVINRLAHILINDIKGEQIGVTKGKREVYIEDDFAPCIDGKLSFFDVKYVTEF